MKQYERKEYLQIIPLTLVCSGYLLLGMGPSLNVVYTPNDNLLKDKDYCLHFPLICCSLSFCGFALSWSYHSKVSQLFTGVPHLFFLPDLCLPLLLYLFVCFCFFLFLTHQIQLQLTISTWAWGDPLQHGQSVDTKNTFSEEI